MIEKIFDLFLALIFAAVTAFSAPMLYNFVKSAALTQVNHGLSSTYRFQKAIDQEEFDWEK